MSICKSADIGAHLTTSRANREAGRGPLKFSSVRVEESACQQRWTDFSLGIIHDVMFNWSQRLEA